jgi:uncharacterized protein (TIGR02145 family)
MESKSCIWIFISIVVCLLTISTGSCKREDIPDILTVDIEEITDVTALSGGVILSDGSAKIEACGICWNTDSTSLSVEDAGHTRDKIYLDGFRSSVTNLSPLTKYYLRAYATNKAGTGYGRIIPFTTTHYVSHINFNPSVNYGTLTDQDGNTYKTVTLGSQTWMAENLKTITFNDGTPLLDSYCWYNFDATSYKADYGALYSWRILDSGNLCPAGWHVPAIDELGVLETYLGGAAVAGGKLKETGTIHWELPNLGATNESGFTLIPNGTYDTENSFSNMGLICYLGSSTIRKTRHLGVTFTEFQYIYLRNDTDSYYSTMDADQLRFFAVRCIKD